jgi:hypothetical protein
MHLLVNCAAQAKLSAPVRLQGWSQASVALWQSPHHVHRRQAGPQIVPDFGGGTRRVIHGVRLSVGAS